VAHTCYFGGARWCRDCGDGVMVEVVVTRASIEAYLLARIPGVMHMQHHPDNVKWIEAHAELDALLLEWEASE
jgi:hypothetical protein